MQAHRIRPADKHDLPALDAALKNLAQDLGDPYLVGMDTLEHAIFGTKPSTWATVAESVGNAAGNLTGAALFTPTFSTARGGAGAYVSDLWVEEAARGNGIGVALLNAVADRARGLWGAGFLRLSVHDHNPRAQALYRSLGFVPMDGETGMVTRALPLQQMQRTQ